MCVTNVAGEQRLIRSQSCCVDVGFTLDELLCLTEALLGGHSRRWAEESNIRDRGTLLSLLHSLSRTHTHGSEWGQWKHGSVSLGPRPSSTHSPAAIPTRPLTSYWPCSLIIRSAWTTLGHFNPLCIHIHTPSDSAHTHANMHARTQTAD